MHIQLWLSRLFSRGHADSYVINRFRCLQAFFKWFVEDEELPTIMLGMKGPTVTEKPVPVFEDDEITKLSDQAQGKDIWDGRDLAIMLMLRDTGMRLMEISELAPDSINVVEREASVMGKARTVKYSCSATSTRARTTWRASTSPPPETCSCR
ncbi:tyrosine-type recombinase/integrase [Nocardiopsis mangrovi]|uniref:Tyrosine-type recombinase/integrase n=1 Tax=Nocardiopsis mangrovi TaxID=1179818 RepID=A0ABV9DXH6_9ACTN